MSGKPDISLLAFDVSNNCMGRAVMLADVLSRQFGVEVIGPASRADGVWLPCREGGIPVRWVPMGRLTGPGLLRQLAAMVNGRLVYALKPRLTSFGAGLLARRQSGLPLVLDIDDWEGGFYRDRPRQMLKAELRHPGNLNNALTTLALERLTGRAEAVTVSSTFLKRRFGGLLVPHCRDTARLDPDKYDRKEIRARHSWSDSLVVMFLGTPTAHKGIDILLAAAGMMDVPGLRVVIAGAGAGSPYWQRAGRQNGHEVEVLGQMPMSEIPVLLAAADIMVMPQLAGPASAGQVPAKLFDAMAMGRAVIASAVSDIPGILGDSGLLCQPGSAVDLAAKLTVLAASPEWRRVLGARARQRCIDRYSHEAVAGSLCGLMEKFVG